MSEAGGSDAGPMAEAEVTGKRLRRGTGALALTLLLLGSVLAIIAAIGLIMALTADDGGSYGSFAAQMGGQIATVLGGIAVVVMLIAWACFDATRAPASPSTAQQDDVDRYLDGVDPPWLKGVPAREPDLNEP